MRCVGKANHNIGTELHSLCEMKDYSVFDEVTYPHVGGTSPMAKYHVINNQEKTSLWFLSHPDTCTYLVCEHVVWKQYLNTIYIVKFTVKQEI